MKPWPDERIVSPWIWTSISSQWANSLGMIAPETGIVRHQILDRLVGEDDAPAERVVGPVALEEVDLVRRVAQLHRDREIEPGRPAAEARDAHAPSSDALDLKYLAFRGGQAAATDRKAPFSRERNASLRLSRGLCKGPHIGYAFVTKARTFDSGDGSVEANMPIGAGSYGAVLIDEAGPRGRRLPPPARRAVFLLGTSLFVYAALPTAALAQQECGAAAGWRRHRHLPARAQSLSERHHL